MAVEDDLVVRKGGEEALQRGLVLLQAFADKTALFDAVVVLMQTEASASIEARARGQRKVWDRLGAGIDACLEPAYTPATTSSCSATWWTPWSARSR
ncbi:hypothetical protein [Ramlibacter sp.]|uniref:hypothetical protein n=1 Tax=Ramlibacter sp. TaxID=1917967 RepID=UPI0025FB77AC|nr:hypothetical protein [Ramlibacter sp.]